MESKLIQLGDEWFSVNNIEYIHNDAAAKKLLLWYADTKEEEPYVLENGKREAFLRYLEKVSYIAAYEESTEKDKGIPISVLADVCTAIRNDRYALGEAAKTMAPIKNDFIGAMNSVILYISEPEVREAMYQEIKGVDYVSDNK